MCAKSRTSGVAGELESEVNTPRSGGMEEPDKLDLPLPGRQPGPGRVTSWLQPHAEQLPTHVDGCHVRSIGCGKGCAQSRHGLSQCATGHGLRDVSVLGLHARLHQPVASRDVQQTRRICLARRGARSISLRSPTSSTNASSLSTAKPNSRPKNRQTSSIFSDVTRKIHRLKREKHHDKSRGYLACSPGHRVCGLANLHTPAVHPHLMGFTRARLS